MEIRFWKDVYPENRNIVFDDETNGVFLDTKQGTLFIKENKGKIEISSPDGLLNLLLHSSNMFFLEIQDW